MRNNRIKTVGPGRAQTLYQPFAVTHMANWTAKTAGGGGGGGGGGGRIKSVIIASYLSCLQTDIPELPWREKPQLKLESTDIPELAWREKPQLLESTEML